MRAILAISLMTALVISFAPAASADPLPFVLVVGPHADANGGATCVDVLVDGSHVGICEGSASCPFYYDAYNGISGCLPTPPVDVSFLPFFAVVGPHEDANGGAQCADILADASHVGTCAGNPACPVYYDLYDGNSGCLL